LCQHWQEHHPTKKKVPPHQRIEYPRPEIMVTYMRHTLQLKKNINTLKLLSIKINESKKTNIKILQGKSKKRNWKCGENKNSKLNSHSDISHWFITSKSCKRGWRSIWITLDRQRLKIKFNAVSRWEDDDSFTHICPMAMRIFCIALTSSLKRSLLNLSCRIIRTPSAD
jgi:hypothetical protein